MKVLDPTTDNDGASYTSYHGVKIKASYAQLSLAFGDAEYIGDEKVSYQWICETEDGKPFTLYDWKEGRFNDEKVIEWHIGSLDRYSSLVAKDEVTEELMRRLGQHFPNDQTFGQEIRKTILK
jgi:hypothetical protein